MRNATTTDHAANRTAVVIDIILLLIAGAGIAYIIVRLTGATSMPMMLLCAATGMIAPWLLFAMILAAHRIIARTSMGGRRAETVMNMTASVSMLAAWLANTAIPTKHPATPLDIILTVLLCAIIVLSLLDSILDIIRDLAGNPDHMASERQETGEDTRPDGKGKE